ncbi:MAG: hypothetical protein H0S82_08205 [Anaerolineaceae bacterium]|nr:hypothetical protein [Anaerolineaceae bacterium]
MPEDDPLEPDIIDSDEEPEEQPAPRNAISCWMALLLIMIASCLLMRVLCFNLSVFNFDPIPFQ